MKDFLEKVLTEGAHRREYEVVVSADDIGEFMNELVKVPGILYRFQADYWAPISGESEYVVTFTIWHDRGTTEDK